MRLLPQTPRGAWLLAGVVWATACAALWWALPVRPRDIIPGVDTLAGFLPDGKSVLVASSDRTVVRYDAYTGGELSRFSVGLTEPPTWGCAAMSPNGRFLVWAHAGSPWSSVLAWDIAA